ncbi:hypothetical protein HL658_29000 [Azospirillum sp. RWY-5-1]|uniref:DUF2491 domain-containing protein n=1 Tax=Azospirillum oleiclasticum TaxID=2735135 RepID=A0ABX2TIB8_9PROT|nr:hypothetical protein [Azospirillum oleiclasticum]NYZ16602.1 hypothetical protein [Azospirillum oleiclasticum]NYZ24089.1 hypothetical protein [Azospirillum oleiclasticum]
MLSARLPLPIARVLRVALVAALTITSGPVVPAVLGGAVTIAAAGDAEARSRSSGGYSRPSSSVRTPSVSSSSSSRSSGGYSRPSADRTPSVASPRPSAPSSFDRNVSRQSGYDSLQDYRRDQQRSSAPPAAPAQAERERTPSSGTSRRDDGWSWNWGRASSSGRTPSVASRPVQPSTALPVPPPGYQPPPYAGRMPSRYGVTDALMWWFLLDSIGDVASAYALSNAARSHPDDYRAFRADAERVAAENPQVRDQLARADAAVAEAPAAPSQDAPAGSSGGGWGLGIVLLILIVGGGIGYMVFIRRNRGPRSDARGDASASAPAGASRRFRVGMPVQVDPTPFLLAGDAVKVTAPDAASGSATVKAVGVLRFGGVDANRLYVDEDRFFEVYVGAGGALEGCRWFTLIDEVTPSREDWPVWLDPNEGMLHYHAFETQDGVLYERAWGPAAGSAPPREYPETIAAGGGAGPVERKHTAMLYRRGTGLADPAPATEYLLVDVVENAATRTASVRLYAGIDINPATLAL